MIKQADKKNINNISTLIYDAIHSVANTLTGENEDKKILETLDYYIKMDISGKLLMVQEFKRLNIET